MKIQRQSFLLGLLLLAGLASPAKAQNLLTNPDFSAGNTGFQTAYTYLMASGTSSNGSYTVTTNTNNFGTYMAHPLFQARLFW